eukprot:1381670-Ditylum_brightwellii.AAC.1
MQLVRPEPMGTSLLTRLFAKPVILAYLPVSWIILKDPPMVLTLVPLSIQNVPFCNQCVADKIELASTLIPWRIG